MSYGKEGEETYLFMVIGSTESVCSGRGSQEGTGRLYLVERTENGKTYRVYDESHRRVSQ